jgi:hypothetical protein
MDGRQFDVWAKALAFLETRRSAITFLAAVGAGGTPRLGMHANRFDWLTTVFFRDGSRRAFVRLLAGGGLAGGLLLTRSEEGAAACKDPGEPCRKNKNCCNKQCINGICKCLESTDPCSSNKECCGSLCAHVRHKYPGKVCCRGILQTCKEGDVCCRGECGEANGFPDEQRCCIPLFGGECKPKAPVPINTCCRGLVCGPGLGKSHRCCVRNNGPCRANEDCCEGSRCIEGSCKTWEGTCRDGEDYCVTGKSPCNGKNSGCACFVSFNNGASRCGVRDAGIPTCCTGDNPCVAKFGPGAFCALDGPKCGCSQGQGICKPPCPAHAF